MSSPNSMAFGRHARTRGQGSAESIRRSPRRQTQTNNRLVANGLVPPTEPLSPAHSAAFYDDHDNLLTPRSPSPPPLNKAAIAAANVKKLRQRFHSLQTKRASLSASLRQPTQKKMTKPSKSVSLENNKNASHPPTTKKHSSASSLSSTSQKRKHNYNIDSPNHQEDDDEVLSDVNEHDTMINSSLPNRDDDEDDIVGRHRQVFMQRAFGDFEAAGNAICRPQEELDQIIFVLKHWEIDMSVKEINDPEMYRAVKAFRETHKSGYKWVRNFWLQHIELPDGTSRDVLRRKEAKHPSGGRIVVSREMVFDAIDEWHRKRGHLGQERTHTFCREKYYNCTQQLVKIYCESCYVCMKKNPTVYAMKGSRKPIRSSGFRDRFQVDLIDFRKMRKRDPFGVLMRWIVVIKDHATAFTYISAIPRKTAACVAHRLQEVFGLIGYPSIFHTDNGKEFTARRILHYLRTINPTIITVTGRPRQPSDQGSVESMNRLVKRLIGSELAERRISGVLHPNWTEVLGSVTAAINSQHGRSANSTSSYLTVYGQTYDQSITCSLEEARNCLTVEQRRKVRKYDHINLILSIIC